MAVNELTNGSLRSSGEQPSLRGLGLAKAREKTVDAAGAVRPYLHWCRPVDRWRVGRGRRTRRWVPIRLILGSRVSAFPQCLAAIVLLITSTSAWAGGKFGDIDSSGDHDIFDIVILTNHRLGITPLPADTEYIGDVDGDRDVDEADVEAVVDAALRLAQLAEVEFGALSESSPTDGEGGVAVTRETILRFSEALDAPIVLDDNILFAQFAGEKLSARVNVSKDRKAVTLFYEGILPSSARVRVTLIGDGLVNQRGVPFDIDGDGEPGGTAKIDFDTLSLTVIPGTIVCGRVFASELAQDESGESINVPLEGVTITVDGMEEEIMAVTDEFGDFRLESAPAGEFFVHIDGRTAIPSTENPFPANAYYPFVGKSWTSRAGEEINIGNIYLPLIGDGTLQPVSETEETLVTFPAAVVQEFPELDGVTVTIPADSLFRDDGTRGGMVGIAPVPPDRLPGQLPEGLDFPLVITVQTDGATNFDEPVPVCFPNLPDPDTGATLPPGAPSALWSFNHDTGRFEVVGPMTVTPDGTLLCTDEGVGILAPGWHGANAGNSGDGGDTNDSDPDDSTEPDSEAEPECANGDDTCAGNCEYGDSVYLHSGEEVFTRTDLVIPGRAGMDFVMRRTYRSRLTYDGPLGHGWNFLYNEGLFFRDNGDVVRHNGRSHEGIWTLNGDGSYTAPPGYFSILERDDEGAYVLTEPDGFQRFYRGEDGRLFCHQDRFGNRMLFDYDPDGNLSRVIDVYAREIRFEFDGSSDNVDRLVMIEDFIGRQITYEYDERGDLVSVTTPAVTGTSTGNDFSNGRTESYTYSSGFGEPLLNHNLLSVTAPEEVFAGGPPRLQWVYGTDANDDATFDRVLSETEGGTNLSGIAAGGTTTFDYEILNEGEPSGQPDLPRGKARITERNGNVMEYFVNEHQLHIITRRFTRGFRAGEPEFFEHRMFYDADGLLLRQVFPEGNEAQYVYDSDGPRRSQSNRLEERRIADRNRGGGADLVTTYTYEPLFNGILSMTDPRGNEAAYVPPLGAQSAARYTTRFFYDYQESSDPIPLADRFGIDLSGINRGLGDLNEDGRSDQVFGNRIKVEAPSVTLLNDSNEAVRLGSTTQPIVTQRQWNDRGQQTARIDGEGNVTDFLYYPENDPDGDGENIFAVYASLGSDAIGYLQSTIVDGSASSRRNADEPDPVALATEYLYDPVGNVIGIVDPRGVLTEIEMNQLNEPVVATRGADVSAAVNSRQLITGEDAFAYQTRYHYDHNGRVVLRETENRDGNTSGVGDFVDRTFTYDILDNPVALTVEIDDATILATGYRYDENELLTRIIEPEGNIIETTYDERNLRFTVTRGLESPDASTIQIDYDQNRNRVRLIDAEDNDGDGQPESLTYAYDGFDRRVSTTDALGNERTASYDVASNAVGSQVFGHPAGLPSVANVLLEDVGYSHDELNRVYQIDEALFLAAGNAPDRQEDLRDENSDGFVTTLMEYDASSRPTFTEEDDGEVLQRRYDGADRLIERVDALGNRLNTQFDQNSNPVSVTSLEISPESLVPDETFTTLYVYDQLDRLVRATDNAGQTTRFAYDSRDNLVFRSDPVGASMADPLGLFPGDINGPGNTKTYVYDGLDRELAQICDLRVDGAGENGLDTSNPTNNDGQVTLGYDWNGNNRLTGITDDNGNRTSFGYDDLNRRTSKTNADTTQHLYAFDRDHNLVQMTDPNGTVVEKSYDALNRIVQNEVTQRASGVVGTGLEAYEYDGLSRLTWAVDDNGAAENSQNFERVYDSLSRIIEERQNGEVVSTMFSGDGKRLECTYPGGRNIENTFDAIDRVRTQSDGGGMIAESRWIGPGYRELLRMNGNGTTLTYLNDNGDADLGYDAVKRTVQHRVIAPNDVTILVDRSYGFNRADQRSFEQRDDDSGLTDRNTYDSLYRVVRTDLDTDGEQGSVPRDLQSIGYQFDGVGNRREVSRTDAVAGITNTTHTVNAMNEYGAISQTGRVHSDNGNLKNDGERLFAYDYRNRLVSVSRKNDGATIAQYLYDTDNRRLKKTVFSSVTPEQVENETLYYYDRWQVCEEQNGGENTEITYVYSPIYIDQLVQVERTVNHLLGAGTVYTHSNARFDVIAVTDAAGAVVEKRFYDDYGRSYDEAKELVSGSDHGNPYGFQGRRFDPETGLYYFRNRYYDPTTGRFLQRDPVWDPGNFANQYTFVGNGPVSATDSLGLDVEVEHQIYLIRREMNPLYREVPKLRKRVALWDADIKESMESRDEAQENFYTAREEAAADGCITDSERNKIRTLKAKYLQKKGAVSFFRRGIADDRQRLLEYEERLDDLRREFKKAWDRLPEQQDGSLKGTWPPPRDPDDVETNNPFDFVDFDPSPISPPDVDNIFKHLDERAPHMVGDRGRSYNYSVGFAY